MADAEKFSPETSEEVAQRYAHLSTPLRHSLEDFYNRFIGLKLIAYGKDWQQENAMEIVSERLQRGDPAFHLFSDYVERTQKNLKESGNDFSPLDNAHIQGLQALIEHANSLAAVNSLNEESARKVYDLLMLYLYGKKRV